MSSLDAVRNVRVPSEDKDIHLPGCSLLDNLTLCGYVWPEGRGEDVDAGATCKGCLAVVKHVSTILGTRRGGRARGRCDVKEPNARR